jgi:phospholipid transport system substrate-binding protein
MKTNFAVFVLLVTSFLGVSAPAWSIENRPDTLVDKTAQEVLAIVRQDKEIQAGNTA